VQKSILRPEFGEVSKSGYELPNWLTLEYFAREALGAVDRRAPMSDLLDTIGMAIEASDESIDADKLIRRVVGADETNNSREVLFKLFRYLADKERSR